GAGEKRDRVSEFGDVGWGDSNNHRGGGLFCPFGRVRLQEPGGKYFDAHGIRDGEGQCREKIFLVGGHVLVACGQAVYGEVDLVWGRSKGAMGVVSYREGLVQFVSHGFIVWGISSSGGVEVSAEQSESSSRVDRGGEGVGIGAVSISKDFSHDV